ncbi:hypothetical protein ACQP3F_29420, partial [Escherichia coli]
PIDGIIWVGLEGVALLQEGCHRGRRRKRIKVSNPCAIPISLCFLFGAQDVSPQLPGLVTGFPLLASRTASLNPCLGYGVLTQQKKSN